MILTSTLLIVASVHAENAASVQVAQPPAIAAAPVAGTVAISSDVRFISLPSGSAPTGITVGHDGRVYVSLQAPGLLGRIDPSSGRVETFSPDTRNGLPHRMTVDADGGVWFVLMGADRVARFDPATSTIREYALGTHGAQPCHLISDSQGSIFVTLRNAGQIARLDVKSGSVQLYPVGAADSLPDAIEMGPDGRVWFTKNGAQTISALSPNTGVVMDYVVPGGAVSPWHFQFDEGGRLWFTENAGNRLGHFEIQHGVVTTLVPPTAGNPVAVAIDPAGRIWFTEVNAGKVASYDPRLGSFREYTVGAPATQPNGLAIGPNGDVYATLTGSSQVAVIPMGTSAPGETTTVAVKQPSLGVRFREGVFLSANRFQPSQRETLDVEIGSSRAGQVVVSVYTPSGSLVGVLSDTAIPAYGTLHVTWAGKNAGNAPVASGVYLIRVDAPTQSGFHRVALVN